MTAQQSQTTKTALATILNETSGFDLNELDHRASFLELGFDSLFLIQFTQKIKNQLKVKVTFRQLIEEIPTLEALIDYVAKHAPADLSREAAVQPTVATTGSIEMATDDRREVKQPSIEPGADALPQPTHPRTDFAAVGPPPAAAESEQVSSQVSNPLASDRHASETMVSSNRDLSGLEQIITQQNQLMALQLELLSGRRAQNPSAVIPSAVSLAGQSPTASDSSSATVVASPSGLPAKVCLEAGQGGAAKMPMTAVTKASEPARKFERFGPYKPVRRAAGGGLTETQQKSLDRLVSRFIKRTRRSREHAQQHRPHFADPRGVAGYRRIWKSIVYQISVERSAGCKLWDIDGNEYIDIAMGFGLNLFGQSPAFVTSALHAQLDRGVEVGPQSPLAGEVAQMLCDFSRQERVTFCNTGSEAVMAAMRLARTVTGKSKIVFFNKDYHGNFEEVLLRSNQIGSQLRTQPAAPGIPQAFADNALVLDYGTAAALETIRDQADEIAAVLIEPVQSADPFTQPKEFLHAIREITRDHDIAMIMDEVITGFRAAQGGAQEWFGVWGDMATYGKILGGGLPIGALAGSRKYMDALDGGIWRYEDDSEPTADMTFFAGTFVRHPLALTAAHQILMKIKEEGPELQQELTRKTSYLVDSLNQFFERELFPFRVAQFASLFRFMFPADLEYADLLYFHLLDRGIFTRGWGDNCFLSTAHSEQDVERIIEAVKESCLEIRAGGFMPRPDQASVPGLPAASLEDSASAKKKTDSLPLTNAQSEIWLGCQMGELASCAYNEPFCLTIRGSLRVDLLRQALDTVFSRHEALRLQFDATPSQRLANGVNWELPITDLSQYSDAQRSAELKKVFDRVGSTPFALDEGPLLRLQLLRCGETEHLLVVSAHHIICDGWSWNRLLREIGQVYSALVERTTYELSPAGSYLDFVQQEIANAEEVATSLQYWTEQYQQLPACLELPTDRPRPPTKSYRGSTLVHQYDLTLLNVVKQLSVELKASLFSITFAAFNVLLAKLSGQDEIVVAVPSAGQSLMDNPNLVGHCMNLLPLRSQIDRECTFAEFVSATTSRILDAYDHQSCTLGQIVQHIKVPRDASRLPLAEVNFNLDRDAAGVRLSGLDIEIAQIEKRAVIFDLFFNLNESDQGLRLDLDYNTDIFDAETIRRWARAFEVLLRAVAANTELKIADIPLLGKEENLQCMVSGDDSRSSGDQDPLVHRLIERQASTQPKVTAIEFEDHVLSYEQLERSANQLANFLLAQGVSRGCLVGLYLNRSEHMVVAALAVLKAGAAFVPLDPSFPQARLEYMAADAALAHIITQDALRATCPASSATIVSIDGDQSQIKACSAVAPHVELPAESPAYVIYTSGSTGRPKGVVIPHRGLSNFMLSMRRSPGLRSEDRLLSVTTMSFDISILEVFLPLLVGARLVIASREVAADGNRLSKLLHRSKTTVMQATPATWRMLIESGWNGKRDLKILCGGEALSRELADQLLARGQSLWNLYGPTETTIWSSVSQVQAGDAPISLGEPIRNTSLFILDEKLRPVPLGVPGNLYIGGEGLALGYLNRPELTAEKFIPNPFDSSSRIYDTGDLARRSSTGHIEFLGRRDHQVKVRGFRIELGEIEQALTQVASISQALVVARTSKSLKTQEPQETVLVAYLVGQTPRPTIAEIRQQLRTLLPEYMLPQQVVFLDAFPMTPNRKIDRQALPEPEPASDVHDPVNQPSRAPRDLLEQQIAAIWKRILGLRKLGVDDNFFDLGGHSLSATRMIAELQRLHGHKVPLAALLRAPSIAGLAELIRTQGWQQATRCLVPIRATGALPPLFCVHAAHGNILLYRDLARSLGSDRPVYGIQSSGLSIAPKECTVQQLAADYRREIQEVQPIGPYYLCGYCLGGTIAYEIAQQLRAAGEEVALLALFDTHSRWFRSSLPAQLYTGLQQMVFHVANVALSGPRGIGAFLGQKLREAGRRGQQRCRALALQMAYRVGLRKAIPARPLAKIYDDATERYVPRSYDGKLTIFKPKHAYWGYEDQYLGWRALASEIDLIELPVYPAGMLLDPFVKELALHLDESLAVLEAPEETAQGDSQVTPPDRAVAQVP